MGITLPIAYLVDFFLYRILKKSSVTVITFHDVEEKDYFKFERIINHIHKRFKFITPDDFIKFKKGALNLSGRHILVTFDDGFRSSKVVTERFLDPLEIKAIFFCCPDFLNSENSNYKGFVANNLYKGLRTENEVLESEIPMTSDEIDKLINNGHSIGGHTLSHLKLASPSTIEDRKHEVSQCAGYFKDKHDSSPIFFAYPFGALDCIDSDSIKLIENKYEYCFSGIRGNVSPTDHPMAVYRQSVTLQDDYLLQLALFYGATNIAHSKKRKILNSFCS